jgi:hypothetical protein
LLLSGLALEGVIIAILVRGATLRSFPKVVQDPDPLLLVYGPNSTGAGRMLLAAAAGFAVYFVALAVSRRARGRLAVAIVFTMAVLFSTTLLVMYPIGSQDLIHNIADARTFWLYGASPLSSPPSHNSDHISAQVVAFAEEPSYYGPLWYLLMGLPNLIGGDSLVPLVLAHKLLVTVFFLASAIVVYRILLAVRPQAAIAGATLYAWNPLVLFEAPGNGHNDFVMVFFVTLAVGATLSRRWAVWPVCLAAAVLVKYSLVIMGPMLLLWTIQVGGWKALRPLGIGVGASILLALLAFAPFWEGPATVRGLQTGLDRWHASIAALLYFGAMERLPAGTAAQLSKAVMLAIFTAGYFVILILLARRRGQAATGLTRTAFHMVFWFLLTMGWWFLPWYVVWLMPFAALNIDADEPLTAITLSATAFLGYVAIAWGRVYWSADPGFGLELSRTLIIWTAPIIVWILLALRRVHHNEETAKVVETTGRA